LYNDTDIILAYDEVQTIQKIERRNFGGAMTI